MDGQTLQWLIVAAAVALAAAYVARRIWLTMRPGSTSSGCHDCAHGCASSQEPALVSLELPSKEASRKH